MWTRDAELLDLMRRSGCYRVALGLESIDQATLDSFDKSQTSATSCRRCTACTSYGIRCHGMFVLGADTDTEETVRATVDFALAHDIDTLMLNILTPAPGTRQFADMEAEGRIFERDWCLYDGQHVVFTPRHLRPADLQAEVLRGYARFYSLRRGLGHLAGLRFAELRDHAWCWWYARRWRWDRANREYLRKLAPRTPGGGGGAPSSRGFAPVDSSASAKVSK